jgi:transcriptional regulator with XRE-family HTH domain
MTRIEPAESERFPEFSPQSEVWDVERYYRLNISTIERMRLSKGWSKERLAEEALTSTRTVDSAIKGRPILLCTLKKLAVALKVDTSILLLPDDKAVKPPVTKRVVVFALEYSVPFSKIDETLGPDDDSGIKQLLDKICTMLKKDYSLEPRIIKGSVYITLNIDPQDAGALLKACFDKTFPDLIYSYGLYDVNTKPSILSAIGFFWDNGRFSNYGNSTFTIQCIISIVDSKWRTSGW